TSTEQNLATLGSKAFRRALSPENIKVGFKRTGIWPLNPNALDEDMGPSRAFDTSVHDESYTAENMMSLSRSDLEVPSNEKENIDDEIVFNTQPNQELDDQHIQINPGASIHQQSTIEIGGSQSDESLTLPTQDSPPDWMKEVALNLGVNINCSDEDVSLSMPSEPTLLNESELVHYYVNTLVDKENDATLETDEVEVTGEIHDEAFERNKDQRTF
ncbi:hypothetical protein KI387_003080, partial [Taxus chinensis]